MPSRPKTSKDCPGKTVLDKTTKRCREPLKRGRPKGSKNSGVSRKCPAKMVFDTKSKQCRPPLKRGRPSKKSLPRSPIAIPVAAAQNDYLRRLNMPLARAVPMARAIPMSYAVPR